MEDNGIIRKFETGATRDTSANKNDYEGFLSPLVLEAFGNYMSENRTQKDGSIRDSDNWQKGIPLKVYMKSGWRHFLQWWKLHRGLECKDENGKPVDLNHAICGLLFNVMGYLHESLKAPAVLLPGFATQSYEPAAPIENKDIYPRFFFRLTGTVRTIYCFTAKNCGRAWYPDEKPKPYWGCMNWSVSEMFSPRIRASEITTAAAYENNGVPIPIQDWPHWKDNICGSDAATKESVLND